MHRSIVIVVVVLIGCSIVSDVHGQQALSVNETADYNATTSVDVSRNIGGLPLNNNTTRNSTNTANNNNNNTNNDNRNSTKQTDETTTSWSSTTSTYTDGISTTSENSFTQQGAGSETTNARPGNATLATANCPSLIPADIKDITEIQGVWYVQAYTGNSGGDQVTQCDVFDIKIDAADRKGRITYTFIEKGNNHPTVEVAEITLLSQASQFYYNVSGIDLSMTTTILVFRKNESYVHLACPTDNKKTPTLVIATKQRTVPASDVLNLVKEAAKQGASVNVRPVNNEGVVCPAAN